MSKYITTLNEIYHCAPCKKEWRKLLRHLNKTKPDDEPLDFETILNATDLDSAVWALQVLAISHSNELKLLACDFAESVIHYVPDKNLPVNTIKIARLYAQDKVSSDELRDAWTLSDRAADATYKQWLNGFASTTQTIDARIANSICNAITSCATNSNPSTTLTWVHGVIKFSKWKNMKTPDLTQIFIDWLNK